MIPTQYNVLQLIIEQLDNQGINTWLAIAPDSICYPYTVLSIPTTNLFSYDFSKNVYDDMIIKFSIYDKDSDCSNILDIADLIEDIMENLTTTSNTIGYNINCSNFYSSIGPRYSSNELWEHIIEYKIIASKHI